MIDTKGVVLHEKCTERMSDEMMKRIGEVMSIAPWTELNLESG